MVTVADSALDLDAEVEEWLWAQRSAVADEWLSEIAEPGSADDVWPDAVDPSPAVSRWIGAQCHREELLFEWEHAAEQVARWQGVQVRILAETLDLALLDGASRSDTTLEVRSLAAELACAVGMSDRTLEQHMNDAQVMRDRFGVTFAALRAGGLSRAHAQVIVDEGVRLDDDAVRAEYEQIVHEIVPHLTTGRLRAAAAAIAEQLMPTTLAERHAEARELRRVVVRDVGDGMAELYALLPAVLAHGIHDRLTRFGRRVRSANRDAARRARRALRASKANGTVGESDVEVATAGNGAVEGPPAANRAGTAEVTAAANGDDESAASDERTMDQLRADALCDVLLTGHATVAGIDEDGGAGIDAIRGVVQITVPIGVATGDDMVTPACLAGHGPIDPESARRLAAGATIWDRILTDPATGNVVAADRRFPTEAQRRLLRARDEHCRFPGCRQPVWRCDADHTIEHQYGGPTTVCNLAHLCRRHHVLKHETAWRVEQLAGGVLVWTSPLGRVYADRPPPTLRFVPTRQ